MLILISGRESAQIWYLFFLGLKAGLSKRQHCFFGGEGRERWKKQFGNGTFFHKHRNKKIAETGKTNSSLPSFLSSDLVNKPLAPHHHITIKSYHHINIST